jgi:hypothetical protein
VPLQQLSHAKCIILDVTEEDIRRIPALFRESLDITTIHRIVFNRPRKYALVFIDSSTDYPDTSELTIKGRRLKILFPNTSISTITPSPSPHPSNEVTPQNPPHTTHMPPYVQDRESHLTKRSSSRFLEPDENLAYQFFYLKPHSDVALEVPEQERLRENIQRDFKEIEDWKIGEFSNKIRLKFRNPGSAVEFSKRRKIPLDDNTDIEVSDPFVRFFLDRVPDFINSEQAKKKNLSFVLFDFC